MKTTNARLVALVRARVLHPKTRHSIDLPAEPTDALEAHPLPLPDVLVIEQEGPTSIFLYRRNRSGEFGGDTHHAGIDEAKHQADFEFGAPLSAWMPIPEEVTDARDFAISVCQ
jgi:hypothetical protein